MSGPYSVTLTNCDREPIQHINAVQPVGFLVALSNEWRVYRASSNTPDFLARPMTALLNAPLADVIRLEAVHVIRDRLAVLSGPDSVERSFAIQLQDGGPLFDLAIHRSGDVIIIEAEPSVATGDLNAWSMIRTMLNRTKGQRGLLREAAQLMQALTGFDRVMIYRFHADGSGEVIAERVCPELEPFFGLRYPAEDIPQQARALLVRNPVRILVDVNATPSPLVPAHDGVNQPLDLSMSTLRAHSTMCIKYLQNMGVGATLTVSLVRDGKLWGLISCHHTTARHVGFEQRTSAELFGGVLSLLIAERERADVIAYEAHTQQLRQELIATVVERGPAIRSVAQLATHLAKLVPCDGYAVYIDDVVTLTGDTPTASECELLRGFLNERTGGQIFATAELGRVVGPARFFADQAAGMLALPISRAARDYLVFFRHERAHAVTWAGRPGKLRIVSPEGPRLSPRNSFTAWREIIRGQSAPWTPAELTAAEMMRITLLEFVLRKAETTETEIRAVTQKQELLIGELNHRVRNILGLIQSLVTQSRLSARDVDAFAAVLGDRIHALARAHNQVTATHWGPVPLASLIEIEAAAFLGELTPRISLEGPSALLQPLAFTTLALVIHELMTNAVKHGALAGIVGKVAIAWTLDEAGNLTLEWSETDGPMVMQPTRRGFGSTIIHRSIPHQLGGKASIDYALDGLRARFVVPSRHVVRGGEVLTSMATFTETTHEGRLTGTVQLVEDNMIIALESEDLLMALGAESVLVASTVAEALHQLSTDTPTFALLDINLGSEMSWPIALRLRELGVRYAFATGYGDAIKIPIEHRGVPVVTKPYTRDSIARVLGEG